MNRKSIIVAAALAAASMSGFAIEAEQFVPPASSSLSREEVRAELRDLQAAGAWQAVTEASITPLQAAETDAKIAQLPSQTRVAQLSVPMDSTGPLRSEDELMGMAEPAVTIEAVPLDDTPVQASAEVREMYHHPAIAVQSDGE